MLKIKLRMDHSFYFILLAVFVKCLLAQTDLPERNFGPSKGRIPIDYYEKIMNCLEENDKSATKYFCKLAINHFLDDDSPLPKNIYGIFRDENGNDVAPLYRSHEGCDDLMYALLQGVKRYPEDIDFQNYYEKILDYADAMLEFATDRYGNIKSPLLASILTRDPVPKVPEDPDHPGHGVRIKKHNVYSYDKDGIKNNWVAVGVGNIWYGSNESHKSSWHGTDLAQDEKLYDLLYELSALTENSKYRNAAAASLEFWLANCSTETHLFPWGEHSGWNFFTEHYDQGWYHSRYHEFDGGEGMYDKFIEHQPRVKTGELTVMEKFALAHVSTSIGRILDGKLQGMFVYGRHQPLWAYRDSAAIEDADLKEFGNFPRIAGSILYSQAFAYNRSNNPDFKESVVKHMNLIADGLEEQRSRLGVGFYPYLYPVSSKGTFDTFKNYQNNRLGVNAMRAAFLMKQANACKTIIDKLIAIGKATGKDKPVVVESYYGPSMVTGVIPENKSMISDSIVTLSWTQTERADSYHIYVSEHADDLRTANTNSPCFVGNTSDTHCSLAHLEPEKQYFWSVDAVGKAAIRKGEINSIWIKTAHP
ncbi:MAG: hypothetical protein U5R06_12305 [candidate division KSB1 bacterium]|nr:hypothetical protein [candidate division KSB1 bacterium]